MRFLLILLLLTSCSTVLLKPQQTSVNRTDEFQQEIDELIAKDAENKRWARLYLQEIDAAMRNDDIPAYVFFVAQYEQIPKEIVPKHLRNEPGYVEPPSDLELHFRLRWWEQAIKTYLLYSNQ